MATLAVQTLLGAVRRRLWTGRFIAAARTAAWVVAALMLLALAVHLATRRAPLGAVLWAWAAPWGAMAVRAASRRPTDAECALWADRHLGGASAFSTLLELGPDTPAAAIAPARRWLQAWVVARVPQALQRLAARQEPSQLARPLSAMLVCTALAALVLTLPDPAPPAQTSAAPSVPPRPGDRLAPVAEAPSAPELASELASALRAAAAPERAGAGGAPAAGPARADAGPPGSPRGAMPAGRQVAGGPAANAQAPDATPAAGAAPRATGAGAGRDAGDSPDERADVGVSRLPQGTIAVQRSEVKARHPAAESLADMDRLASYVDEPSIQGTAATRAPPAVPAAMPPAATQDTRLTPTETSYVQAWMKASGQHR
jgi:hypothetical protein